MRPGSCKQIIILLIVLAPMVRSFAQNRDTIPTKAAVINKISTSIKIDGIADEQEWQEAAILKDFWVKYPTDDHPPKNQTEARIMYNDEFLYVFFTAYDSGRVYVRSLKRDIGHDGNDGVAVVIDPQDEKASGFFFVVNAYNAQSDEQLAPFKEPTFSWDAKWFSATKRHQAYWNAEIAIPFKSLRYDANKKQWALNLLRVDMKTSEYSVWNRIPLNFDSHDLGYTGKLIWNQPPPAPGRNMVFIPYATTQWQNSSTASKTPAFRANAGFDAKIGLRSDMNLDLTVNPDFAQVDVDQQVTNLTRFSIFFPEKRNFFLENADLFSEYGMPGVRPFYSRRIGLDEDGNTIPIIGGARLTGNATKTTRFGIMNMQTAKKYSYNAQNYSAISVSQKLWSRSAVKGYFLNREEFGAVLPFNKYGRNGGTEFLYTDESGTWNGWAAYHHSFKPGISDKNKFLDLGGSYNSRTLNVMFDLISVGTNYYTDMGFNRRINNYDAIRDTVIRMGYKQGYNEIVYKIYPKGGKILTHQFQLENFLVLNPDYRFNELTNEAGYRMMFRNTSSIMLDYEHAQTHLYFPISFTESTPLPTGHYTSNAIEAGYHSDYRKTFTYEAGIGGGQFYNGKFFKAEADLRYIIIPHLNLSTAFEYYNLLFPEPYGKTQLFLIAPKIDFNFSTNLFWTTFLQYNTQDNNVNINSRFQWRYKPMSDIFLVYTDNYFTTPFMKNKNRGIIFKVNYWLNF